MRSLRARLNTAFVLPTGVIVVLLVVVAYLAARQGLEDELDRRLEEVGQVLAVDMSEGIDAAQISRLDESMHRVRDRLRERLGDVQQSTEVGRIFIFDAEARSLVDTDDEIGFGDTLYRIQSDRSEVQRAFDEQVATSGPLFRADDGIYHKTAYAPIIHEGETVAAVGVEASADYFGLLTRFATVLTLLSALGIGIVVAIGVWFSRVLSRPVDTLVEGAEHLAEGRLQTPVVAQARKGRIGTEEFDFLMQSFEEAREAILERDQRMQMMLGGIAHEVRNPLGGMELFCGLLKEDLSGDDANADSVQMVERIEREIDYLERVVEGFLDYANPDEPRLERVDAADVVDEVAELVEPELITSGCELDRQVPDGLELTVDRGQVRRALMNVVRNACQACADDPAPVVVRCSAEEHRRVIEVVDGGCGIESDQIQQLCRPFYTNREKGSGLGLALTRRIVDAHDGQLDIESTPGEGTTVRMVFPFDDDVSAGDEQPADQQQVPEGWLG